MNVVHDISQGPGDRIYVSDRENGKLKVYDKALNQFVDEFENAQQMPQVFASVYSRHDSNIYLGKFGVLRVRADICGSKFMFLTLGLFCF